MNHHFKGFCQWKYRKAFSASVLTLALVAGGSALAHSQSAQAAQNKTKTAQSDFKNFAQTPRYRLAQDNFQSKLSRNTPMASYWLPESFLNWSPDKDKDLPYNRSTVPLAKRIDKKKLPVSNTAQNKDTKIVALSIVNEHTSGNAARHDNNFKKYTFDYWQYIDTLVYWAGSASEGIIVPPSADTIEMSHKNGVPVLGVIYLPPSTFGGRTEWVKQMLQKDASGHYPFAKKMAEVARSYGFDGWFLNEETEGLDTRDAQAMRELIKEERAIAPELQVMWYDSMTKNGFVSWQNELNDENVSFVKDGSQKLSDSMFLNFDWQNGSELQRSRAFAKAHQIDPYEIYAGIDVQAMDVRTPVDWRPFISGPRSTFTSLGLYVPSSTFTNSRNFADFQEREKRFWVNQAGDPRKVDGVNGDNWVGLSRFAVERSVIQGQDFQTNFNIGNGHHYFKKGQLISNNDWSNRGLAGILPTYRWIIDNEGQSQLKGEIDYEQAYDGGNSLKFSGPLQAGQASTVTLFSTDLQITNKTVLSAALRANDTVNVKLIAQLANGQKVEIPANQSVGPKWTSVKFDKRALVGKTVRKLSVKFDSAKTLENCAINLGKMTVSSADLTSLSDVSDLKVDEVKFEEASTVAGVRLSWQAHKSAAFDHYEINRINKDGSRTFLGSSDSNHYFINGLKRDGQQAFSKIEVLAVNKQGDAGQTDLTGFKWPSHAQPKADFFSNHTVIAPGTTVKFFNQSNEAASEFDWQFEGAAITHSNEKNPQIRYDKEGTYSVTLRVKNDSGRSDSLTKKALIVVTKAASNGFVDYALNKQTTADNWISPHGEPFNINDGDPQTKWCANSHRQHWVMIDLGKIIKINAVKLDHAKAGDESADMNTSAYVISISTDGKTWHDVVKKEHNQYDVTMDEFAQSRARYVKLTLIKPTQGQDPTARIYGMAVLGLKDQ